MQNHHASQFVNVLFYPQFVVAYQAHFQVVSSLVLLLILVRFGLNSISYPTRKGYVVRGRFLDEAHQFVTKRFGHDKAKQDVLLNAADEFLQSLEYDTFYSERQIKQFRKRLKKLIGC